MKTLLHKYKPDQPISPVIQHIAAKPLKGVTDGHICPNCGVEWVPTEDRRNQCWRCLEAADANRVPQRD